jgi:hypothetical protein
MNDWVVCRSARYHHELMLCRSRIEHVVWVTIWRHDLVALMERSCEIRLLLMTTCTVWAMVVMRRTLCRMGRWKLMGYHV